MSVSTSLSAAAPAWRPAAGAESTWRPLDATPERYEANAADGTMYVQRPNGDWRVLAEPGGTHDSLGPQGQSDVPAEAVVDNKVFIYVDGIHQKLSTQKQQIADLLHHLSNNSPSVVVRQPVVAIHQGMGRGERDCGTRILGDMEMLKALQARIIPCSAARLAFRWDKAAGAVHNTLRQSLQAGHDIQLMVHSGGGAEVALALQLLAREGFGDQIGQHVRILSCSAPVSRRDYENTGVKPENIFLTGDRRDVVFQLGERYVRLDNQFVHIPPRLLAYRKAAKNDGPQPQHDIRLSFGRNEQLDGTNTIQSYLDGHEGGDHVFS